MSRLENLMWLTLIAKSHPEIWDIIPKYRISEGTVQAIAGMMLKSISEELKEENFKDRIYQLGQKVFKEGTQKMDYDNDNWCRTRYPIHWPGPRPHVDKFLGPDFLKPGPSPWQNSVTEIGLDPQAMSPMEEKKMLAAELKILSGVISNKDLAGQVLSLAKDVANG